jgi:TonB family protein
MVSERAWLFAIAAFASGLAHVLAWLSVGEGDPSLAHRSRPPSIVDFDAPPASVALAPPVHGEPLPAPALPKPPKVAAPRPASAKESSPAKGATDSQPQPPVAELAGVTLTGNATGATWVSPVGHGEVMKAPLPAIGSGPPSNGPAPGASASTAAGEPSLVPLRDLSAKPRPPSLDYVLQRNYPADARRRGLDGSARVAARVEPDGVVRSVRVLSENDGGFGEACRRTLLGSRWSAPVDALGRAVFTEIRYTCRFQVMR